MTLIKSENMRQTLRDIHEAGVAVHPHSWQFIRQRPDGSINMTCLGLEGTTMSDLTPAAVESSNAPLQRARGGSGGFTAEEWFEHSCADGRFDLDMLLAYYER
jgi:hypothetical protein